MLLRSEVHSRRFRYILVLTGETKRFQNIPCCSIARAARAPLHKLLRDRPSSALLDDSIEVETG